MSKSKLIKLAEFLSENDIVIVKSAPSKGESHSNKLAVCFRDGNKFIDYEFEEDITNEKILDNNYKVLKNIF